MIPERTAKLAASDAIANAHAGIVLQAEQGHPDPYLLAAQAQAQATAALALAITGAAPERCRAQRVPLGAAYVLRCEQDQHDDTGMHLAAGVQW